MIVKILKRSSSFNGSWMYHFHDKKCGAGIVPHKTSERVEMCGFYNLGTFDPEIAFKMMELTWYSAEDLKRQSGKRNNGRKCSKPLMTIVISYHAGYVPERNRVESDVNDVLELSGLTENQCVWVMHNDTDNAHVHLIINTIHPETGIATQLDNSVAKKIQNWAKRRELSFGHVQCLGRLNPAEIKGSQKFISTAERKARKRIGNNSYGIFEADKLAELTRQEWINIRSRESDAVKLHREGIENLRKVASIQRKAIKAAAASRIKYIYKKRNFFIFSKGWFDQLEWVRFGKRARAARRLFYTRERSVFGILMNSAHLSLSNISPQKSFTQFLLSKKLRREGLEIWIASERNQLKNKQNIKKTMQVERVREAENRAYIDLSKSLKVQIQLKNREHEVTLKYFQTQRSLLKDSCRSRWDSLVAVVEAENEMDIKITEVKYNELNF